MVPTYATPVGLPKICLAFDWLPNIVPLTKNEVQLDATKFNYRG